MNYYEAAKIRKKGFADLMLDKLTSGQGVVSSVRSALSDRSKARSLGFKEKFDPLNIAKVLTGGSNLAPALLGKMLGRSRNDINYFAGKKQYERTDRSGYSNNFSAGTSVGSYRATAALQKMLSFMEKSRTDDIQEQETMDSFNELNEKMREDRHKEVVDVFIEATKARRKAEKDMAKEAKKRQKEAKKEAPKKEAPPAKKEVPQKEAPPAKTEAPPPKTEAPPAKTGAPASKTAEPVQTAPPAPPTATPAPPVTTPKLPMVKPGIEAAKTAAKVGAGVAAGAAATMAIKRIVEVGSGYNVVELQSGEIVRKEGAWNWRNNNPGNIEYGEYALSKGAIPFSHGKNKPQSSAERFAIFPTYEDGRNAKAGLIFEGKNYKNLSLDEAIARYAPPSENDTIGYQKAIKTSLNLPEEKLKSMKMQDFNQEQRLLILDAMQKQEGYGSGKKQTKILSAGSNVPDTGNKLNETSQQNTDMKKDMSQSSTGGSPVIVQNNNTTQSKTNMHRAAPQEQLNPTMR